MRGPTAGRFGWAPRGAPCYCSQNGAGTARGAAKITRRAAAQYRFNIGTTAVCGSPPVTWTFRSLSMYTFTSLRTPNSGR